MNQQSRTIEIERGLSVDEATALIPSSAPPAERVSATVPRAPFSPRKQLMTAAILAALGTAIWYGWDYWTVGRYLISTDDAYVRADHTTVAPKVSGYLQEVLVGDNQYVKTGQILAQIDDRDFKAALDQAEADVAASISVVASKLAQLEVQEAVVEASKATIEVDKANVLFAAQENKRYTDLATSGYGSVQNAQQARARFLAAEAATQRDAATLESALKQIDLLKADIAQAKAHHARAIAASAQAGLNLGYTTITAAIDGVVGNRTLRVGQYVQAGTQLMSLVPLQSTYVVANFKETQLTNVHEGQSVTIAVDMFPGKIVHGRVDSIAPASGQEFALLPPDNATGNFTKVVQRIPVRIAFDKDPLIDLRAGTSVIPTIQTRPDARTEGTRPAGTATIAAKR